MSGRRRLTAKPDERADSTFLRRSRFAARVAGRAALLAVLAAGYFVWTIANPTTEALPLADSLISTETAEGRALRERAVDRADLGVLQAHFETQRYRSYCGVASSVIALNALGMASSQQTFFDAAASEVRGRWATFFAGMTLEQLGGLLAAHGARTEVVHAADVTLDDFRSAARENLSRDGDLLLINYLRSAVDQESGGHISPVGAYDEVTDRFLVLDVSTYKYPPVWVTAEALFGAMNTVDSASALSRGYVSVGRR